MPIDFGIQAKDVIEEAVLDYATKYNVMPQHIKLSPRNWIIAYKSIDKSHNQYSNLCLFGVPISYDQDIPNDEMHIRSWVDTPSIVKKIA